MAASINDKITDVRNTARPNSARVQTARSTGGTNLACDNLTGWPTASKVHFVTYQIDTNSNPIGNSQLDCSGIVSGSTITNLTVIDGTDAGNSVGDVVEMLPTAAWGQDLADALTVGHERTGVHKASLPLTTPIITTPSIITGGTWMGSPTISTPTISDLTNSNHTHLNAAGGGVLTPSAINKIPLWLAPVTDASNQNINGANVARTGLTFTFTAPYNGYAYCQAFLWGRPASPAVADNSAKWRKNGSDLSGSDIGASIRSITPSDDPGVHHSPYARVAIASGVSITLAVYVSTSIATNYGSASTDWATVQLVPTEYTM